MIRGSVARNTVDTIEWLNRNKRYVEALYFGALQLARAPTAELHLELGLACCGAIRPVAMLNRMLYEPGTEHSAMIDGGGLLVSNGTLLVYEGYFHFIESLRKDPQVRFASELEPVVGEVLEHLTWYVRQEFHGLGGGLPYNLRSAALGAILLLHRLGRSNTPLPSAVERSRATLEENIENHLRSGPAGTSFDPS